VSFWLLGAAAALLGIERVCYVWIARAPESFRGWATRPAVAWLGEPLAIVRALFLAFKALQYAVFAGWCWLHGTRSVTPTDDLAALAIGGLLVTAGQILNGLVFYRLGRVGVFFGDRLGHAVTWCEAFPFSRLDHPQYLGSVLTIWGFFLLTRFPHDDWYLLPALETVYYAIGAHLENPPASRPAPSLEGSAATRETCPRPASVRSG
jgi:hypothetical protein